MSGYIGTYEGYAGLVEESARFLKTGKPPVAQAETLEIDAFREAADESKRQDGKPVTLDAVMEKAGAAAAGESSVARLSSPKRNTVVRASLSKCMSK